ncbi:P-loop containing nucleoside triphosphate hydrolase protein, partial [Xylariales sp. PMI_506]
MRRVFEQTAPGFSSLQDFFAKWLNMDITTLAVALTMFGAISTGTSHIRHIALEVYRWVVRFFTASVSIPGHDRLNSEVLNWVGAHVLTQQQTRILTARSEHTMNEAWEFRRPGSRRIDFQVEKRLPIQYLPTFGVTWFFHERNVFLVRRIPDGRDFIPLDGDDAPDHYAVAPAGTEPLVVMCLGRSVRPIKRFLTACRNFASKQRESFITVRISRNQYHHDTWDTTILRPMRPLNTVHMEQAVKDELLADVENYLKPSTRRFYTNRGIPYRRGYLLHGPPGTGKTSLSLALAGRFGLELYILHIPSLSEDGELERLFTSLPPKCIVLLEDIDAVGMKRSYDDSSDSDSPRDRRSRHRRLKSRGGGGSTNCTLSGLLNVLDGVTSQEGRIVLMTSNVVDQLDEALVRPGRIDKMIFMGKIRAEAAEDMFLRMFAPDEESSSIINNIGSFDFDDELRDLAVGFGRSIPDDMFTPAQLQGYLLNHRDQPARAVAQLSAWIEEEKERMAAAREREEKQRKKREARRQEELEKEMARFV